MHHHGVMNLRYVNNSLRSKILINNQKVIVSGQFGQPTYL